MGKSIAQVIIPKNLLRPPEAHEIEVAWIVANHYQQAVEFLEPIDDYKRPTPDFVMNGMLWEVKSPSGKARRNVERQIKRAMKQSRNIIIDGRRTIMPDDVLISRLQHEAKAHGSIRKLLLFLKRKKSLKSYGGNDILSS